MAQNNTTLNNVINFITSEFVLQFIPEDEQIDSFIKYAFKVSKDYLIKEVGTSMMEDKKSIAVMQMNTSKENLLAKLEEFIKLNNIEHEDVKLLPFIFDKETKNEEEFKKKYNVSLEKANQIFDLRNSLL